MSIPIPNQSQVGQTSYVTGQVSYGWISEAWRLFSAQMGPWIVGTLVLSAPAIIFGIVFYAMMLTTMFQNGFPGAAPPVPAANGLPTAPLTPGTSQAQMNAQMAGFLPLELGFVFVYSFWSAYVCGGLFRMSVRQVRGVPVEMKDIFRGGPLFGRMLGATFLLVLGAYGLEALCLAPMGLIVWRHGSPLATGLTAAAGIVLVFVLFFSPTGCCCPHSR